MEFRAVSERFKGQRLNPIILTCLSVCSQADLFVILLTGRQRGEGRCAEETKENRLPSQGVHINIMIRNTSETVYVLVYSLNSILSCVAR